MLIIYFIKNHVSTVLSFENQVHNKFSMIFTKARGCGNMLNFSQIHRETSEKMDSSFWLLIQLWPWIIVKVIQTDIITYSLEVSIIILKAVLNWAWTRCSWAALSVGNIQARGLVLNRCSRSWQAAVFKAHGQALGCSKCCQRRIWEQASDWLTSFVMEEKKQKRG